MRTIDELINLERAQWTKEEKNTVAKFPSLQWMIKFKSDWNGICNQLNKRRVDND